MPACTGTAVAPECPLWVNSVEPAGEFNLKGIRRPMAAYNVLTSGSAQT
jgi:hypothetical protein